VFHFISFQKAVRHYTWKNILHHPYFFGIILYTFNIFYCHMTRNKTDGAFSEKIIGRFNENYYYIHGYRPKCSKFMIVNLIHIVWNLYLAKIKQTRQVILCAFFEYLSLFWIKAEFTQKSCFFVFLKKSKKSFISWMLINYLW